MAGEVSATTAKPAPACTMYLYGVAVGRGMSCAEAASRLRRRVDRRRGAVLDWRD